MPHFILDCSPEILQIQEPQTTLNTVFEAASATGLFAIEGLGRIKVRLRPYEYFMVGNDQDNFIHVFAYIMEGRTSEQQMALSKAVVKALKSVFPEVPIISMNIQEFEAKNYINRGMV